MKLENTALKEGLRLANSEISSLKQRGTTLNGIDLNTAFKLDMKKRVSGEPKPKPKPRAYRHYYFDKNIDDGDTF